ncbi:glycosyl transferase [Candidatus Methanoperedens nitroreducens]|uniref:dolichyl-phosphate beta-glucosyltransferase n=1 Tax=Candidatus Methanoperedens nitratireducens TaxID=1392998 RepID=A0A062V7X6_9EURY|nr:dolichyl-phosphate beta-glucosyltransferase [Candidatus Methanoperedens nitroreducens]KCZ71869.1 glycosyl transferase [Candidatus Methanoperedens nitroreducens]MDJ1422157.1 glycosyltransferase family 2 protein [Candidatus Methanoperedens sp.]
MKLSLIIPAYNEEKRINKVISSYSFFLDKKYDYELIVVCDGDDNTPRIVQGMMADNPRIKLLEFSERQGKGGAILQGLRESCGEVVGFVDSDEAVSPGEFERLIDALDCTDCAIASRRVKGAQISVNQPLKRRISSRMFNILVNLLFGLGIRDTQCGAKVFKREVLDLLLPVFKTRGFEFDVELLWRIKNADFKIKEVPITWKHEEGSTFSLKYSSMMFLSLLRIRLYQ